MGGINYKPIDVGEDNRKKIFVIVKLTCEGRGRLLLIFQIKRLRFLMRLLWCHSEGSFTGKWKKEGTMTEQRRRHWILCAQRRFNKAVIENLNV